MVTNTNKYVQSINQSVNASVNRKLPATLKPRQDQRFQKKHRLVGLVARLLPSHSSVGDPGLPLRPSHARDLALF